MQAIDRLEDEAIRRASEGVSRPVLYKGRQVFVNGSPIYETEFSDTLLIALLKGLRPETYNRDRHEIMIPSIGPENEQARQLAEIFTVEELEEFKVRLKKLREREAAGQLGTRSNPIELTSTTDSRLPTGNQSDEERSPEQPIQVTSEVLEQYHWKNFEAPEAPAGSGWQNADNE
jgi:hypothetical protein